VKKLNEIKARKFVERCVLSRGVEINDLLKVRKEAILYVQPCASERGRLMADIELSQDLDADFFEKQVLCKILEIHSPGFAELKCSPSLGVAKFVWKGREISVFKNGKIKIQRCLDRADILKVANRVVRLVWGAILCEVCGRPAVECASGKCGACAKKEEVCDISGIPGGEILKHAFELAGAGDKKRAGYFTLHFVVETPKKEDATVGLAILEKFLGD